MKLILFFLFLNSISYPSVDIEENEIVVTYLKKLPNDASGFTYNESIAFDYIDRPEYLLAQKEKELVDQASELGNISTIEIFLEGFSLNELPTESQIGRKAEIRFYYRFVSK